MSRARDVLRRDDAGFTLIEVLVAFLLLALVSAAMVPLLVLGSTAATQTRMQTEAKNLAQERLEQMRQLPFHVARQNGPYVDLLDNYFPGRTAAAGLGSGWVAEGATPRRLGEPTGSFYRVVLDPVPQNPEFAQVVATQFLQFDRTPVLESAYPGYTSQVSGLDGPPSLFLGVTVLTSWTANGQAKSTSVFTQIADPGAPTTLIASRAKVTALRVESSAPDTTFLTAEAGTVQADGQLSAGSSASVTATAGRATRTSANPWAAISRTSVAPGTDQFPSELTQAAVGAPSGGCRPAAFGRSSVSKVTSAVVGGVPFVPSDTGNGVAVPTNQAVASLLASPGGSCGAFWFGNETVSSNPRLQLRTDRPLVAVAGTTAGTSPIVQGAAWVNGTPRTTSPVFIRAGASATMVESVGLFYTDYAAPDAPLLRAQLSTGSIVCDSRTTPPATSSYQMTLQYRAVDGSYQPVGPASTFSWSSTTGPATDPLAGVDLTTKVVHVPATGSPLTLADYISSWSSGRRLTEGNSGVAGLDAALRITTVPTRTDDPTSSVGVVLGAMSCVADDSR